MQITANVLVLVSLAALLVSAVARKSNLAEWQQYKLRHRKVYANKTEDAMRFSLFLAAKNKVARHNLGASLGHQLGLNHLADWTPKEFAKLNGLLYNETEHKLQLSSQPEDDEFLRELLGNGSEPPKEVDWRKVPGRVSEVKDQRHCGSCWSFATTGILEGQQYRTMKNRTVPLSEQQLLECSKHNMGCLGGLMPYALFDIFAMGGIESEKDYPYTAPKVGDCRYQKSKVVFNDAGPYNLPERTEEQLMKVVANYGPVAVGISATENLRLYKQGIFRDPICTHEIDHAVLVVGYGTDDAEGDYWIVKNSWGLEWGEEGYFRIARGVGMCGMGQYSTIAKF